MTEPAFNLLRDPWIPVRRRSGHEELIRSAEVTSRLGDDPVVGFASPRADFDGALAQFLVGLLQTLNPPSQEQDWRRWFDHPPSPEELDASWSAFEQAFEVLGTGARFLQDRELKTGEGAKELPIGKLLIDHGLSVGSDHFVKWGDIEALSLPMAACALLTLQINAPSGGRGHRTGVRGGGPLTTMVTTSSSLWSTLWLNVALLSSLDGDFGRPRSDLSAVFPWLGPTRTSEQGEVTTPADVHPLQVFWAMPRRIWLAEAREGMCDLLPGPPRPVVEGYLTRHGGVNYDGAWIHPLTPYREIRPGERLPRHGSGSRVSYRDWLGLVQEDTTGKSKATAATLVSMFRGDDDRNRRSPEGHRLWAFGYDMDNMKARAWTEGTMPLYATDPARREVFESDVEKVVLAARLAAAYLVAAVKEAWTDRPREFRGSLESVEKRFWEETEARFFDLLSRALEAGEDTARALSIREEWHRDLHSTTERIFDSMAVNDRWDAVDPRRIVRARRGLRKRMWGPKLRERTLGLPSRPKAAVDTTARTSEQEGSE